MKKFFEIIIYLLYKYYNKGGTKDIPYFCATTAFFMIVFLNITTIILLLGGNFDWNEIIIESFGKGGRLLLFSLILIPFFIGLNHVLPKKNIVAVKLENNKIKIYNYLLGSYIFISLASLIIVAIYSKM